MRGHWVYGVNQMVGATLLATTALTTSLPVAAQEAGPKWGAHLDLEGKIGTERNLGEGSLFMPLAQNADTLLFGDLRLRFDDAESHEGNLGLGLRHMLDSGWNLGAYGYFDRRGTVYDNYFNQLTFGAEALGRDFDLRANGYWAIGERTRNVDSLSTAELSGTSVIVRGGEERSMSGFDAEIGWRVPLFDAEAPRQLRLYAGGYRFTADGVDDVTGPRLRADFTMDDLPFLWDGSRLSLGAEWQHDEPRGSQAFAGLRLRIPLQSEPAAPRLTAQERRMTDTVIRDIDVVTQAGAYGAPETATELADGGAFTVISSASTTGSDLRNAVTAAGNDSTVILSGDFQVGTNTINLAFGQTLRAGQTTVRTASGRTAVLTTAAAINGANGGTPVVQVNAGGVLHGLTITNTLNGGFSGYTVLIADFATDVTITNNVITTNAFGANTGVALGGSFGGISTISGNTIRANTSGSGSAIALSIVGSTSTVSGNSISASGSGTGQKVMANVNNATINGGSTGNIRGSGDCTGTPTSGSLGFTNGTTCP